MKRILIVAAVSTLAMFSCKKECDHEEETKTGCTDTQAINYSAEAVEDDGSCTYQWGPFVGNYDVVTGTCDYDPMSYTCEITKGPDANQIIISNFNNEGVNMLATVDGNNFSFSMLTDVGFQGTGYVIDNVVTINTYICEDYNYPDDCTDSYCSYTLTKN